MEEANRIRVGVRVRPLLGHEHARHTSDCIQHPAAQQILVGQDKRFTFDYVWPSQASQTELYKAALVPLIKPFFDGYNVTILVYGQTGSGKTYTIGSMDSGVTSTQAENSNQGIIPRFIEELFGEIAARKDGYEATVTASFLEIYGEEIRDLLPGNAQYDSESLRIREDHGGVWVEGLRQVPVTNKAEAIECIRSGSLQRTTGATLMNAESSRSHAVFTVMLTQKIQEKSEASPENSNGDVVESTVVSKLTFVDLAGSERIKRTGAEGSRMKEGININVGLLALGNVINALAEAKQKSGEKAHIPYRSSKLTRLLQDALGGNSRTLFIACVSPAEDNLNETINTLRYANRAKNIQNKAIKNIDSNSAELLRLKSISVLLQRELVKQVFLKEEEKTNDEEAEKALTRSDVKEYFSTLFSRISEVTASTLSIPASGATPSRVLSPKPNQEPPSLSSSSSTGPKTGASKPSAKGPSGAVSPRGAAGGNRSSISSTGLSKKAAVGPGTAAGKGSSLPVSKLPSTNASRPASGLKPPSDSKRTNAGSTASESVPGSESAESLQEPEYVDADLLVLDELLEMERREAQFASDQLQSEAELAEIECALLSKGRRLELLKTRRLELRQVESDYQRLQDSISELEEKQRNMLSMPTAQNQQAQEDVSAKLLTLKQEQRQLSQVLIIARRESQRISSLEDSIARLKEQRSLLKNKQIELLSAQTAWTEGKKRELELLQKSERRKSLHLDTLQLSLKVQDMQLNRRSKQGSELSKRLRDTESRLVRILNDRLAKKRQRARSIVQSSSSPDANSPEYIRTLFLETIETRLRKAELEEILSQTLRKRAELLQQTLVLVKERDGILAKLGEGPNTKKKEQSHDNNNKSFESNGLNAESRVLREHVEEIEADLETLELRLGMCEVTIQESVEELGVSKEPLAAGQEQASEALGSGSSSQIEKGIVEANGQALLGQLSVKDLQSLVIMLLEDMESCRSREKAVNRSNRETKAAMKQLEDDKDAAVQKLTQMGKRYEERLEAAQTQFEEELLTTMRTLAGLEDGEALPAKVETQSNQDPVSAKLFQKHVAFLQSRIQALELNEAQARGAKSSLEVRAQEAEGQVKRLQEEVLSLKAEIEENKQREKSFESLEMFRSLWDELGIKGERRAEALGEMSAAVTRRCEEQLQQLIKVKEDTMARIKSLKTDISTYVRTLGKLVDVEKPAGRPLDELPIMEQEEELRLLASGLQEELATRTVQHTTMREKAVGLLSELGLQQGDIVESWSPFLTSLLEEKPLEQGKTLREDDMVQWQSALRGLVLIKSHRLALVEQIIAEGREVVLQLDMNYSQVLEHAVTSLSESPLPDRGTADDLASCCRCVCGEGGTLPLRDSALKCAQRLLHSLRQLHDLRKERNQRLQQLVHRALEMTNNSPEEGAKFDAELGQYLPLSGKREDLCKTKLHDLKEACSKQLMEQKAILQDLLIKLRVDERGRDGKPGEGDDFPDNLSQTSAQQRLGSADTTPVQVVQPGWWPGASSNAATPSHPPSSQEASLPAWWPGGASVSSPPPAPPAPSMPLTPSPPSQKMDQKTDETKRERSDSLLDESIPSELHEMWVLLRKLRKIRQLVASAEAKWKSIQGIIRMAEEIQSMDRKIAQFEASASDSSRLKGNSMRLQEEAKFRAMAAKQYPILVDRLRHEIYRWEDNEKKPFNYLFLGEELAEMVQDKLNSAMELMHLNLAMKTPRAVRKAGDVLTDISRQSSSSSLGSLAENGDEVTPARVTPAAADKALKTPTLSAKKLHSQSSGSSR